MSTTKDLIKQALRNIGVIASGEEPSAEELSDSLLIAQQMIESWSLSKLMVPAVTHESFAVNTIGSARTYTIGPSGDIDTVRPLRVIVCQLVDAGGAVFTIDQVGVSQWSSIHYKDSVAIPDQVYFEPAYPLAKLYFTSILPPDYNLKLITWKELSALPALNSQTEYPPGYDRCIRLNLEVELAGAFSRPVNATTAALAKSAMREIKRLNSTPLNSRVDTALLGKSVGYNIDAGP